MRIYLSSGHKYPGRRYGVAAHTVHGDIARGPRIEIPRKGMGRCLFPESILHASGFGGDEDILHINHLPPDELPDTSKVWSTLGNLTMALDQTAPRPASPELQNDRSSSCVVGSRYWSCCSS
jgi:hypothetical protein